jgi:hypothetical protein
LIASSLAGLPSVGIRIRWYMKNLDSWQASLHVSSSG